MFGSESASTLVGYYVVHCQSILLFVAGIAYIFILLKTTLSERCYYTKDKKQFNILQLNTKYEFRYKQSHSGN